METINIDSGQNIINKKLVLVHKELHEDEVFMNSFNENTIIVEVDDTIDISDIYQIIDDEDAKIDRLAFVYHYNGPNPLRFFQGEIYNDKIVEKNLLDISGIGEHNFSIPDISGLESSIIDISGLGKIVIDNSNVDLSGVVSGSGIITIDASAVEMMDLSGNTYNVDFVYRENVEVNIGEKIEPKYKFISDKVVSLIETLNNKLEGQLIVDILTCNLNDAKIVEEIAVIQEDLNINIQYSVDQTGNNPQGNWVLESDNVNVKDVYFTEGIDEWSGVLFDNITYIDITTTQTNTVGGNRHRTVVSEDHIFINNNYTSDTYYTEWRQVHRDDRSSSRPINSDLDDLYTSGSYASSGHIYSATEYRKQSNGHEVTNFKNNYWSEKFVRMKFDFSDASKFLYANANNNSYGLARYTVVHRDGDNIHRYGFYNVYIYNVMFRHTLTDNDRYIYINEGYTADILYNTSNIKFTTMTGTPNGFSYGFSKLHTRLRYNGVENNSMGDTETADKPFNSTGMTNVGDNPLLTEVALLTSSTNIKYILTLDKDLQIRTLSNIRLIDNYFGSSSYVIDGTKFNISIRLTHNYTPPTDVDISLNNKPFYDINYVIRPILSSSSIDNLGITNLRPDGNNYIIDGTFNCNDIPTAVSASNFIIETNSNLVSTTNNNDKTFTLTIHKDNYKSVINNLSVTVTHPNDGVYKYPNGSSTNSNPVIDSSSTVLRNSVITLPSLPITINGFDKYLLDLSDNKYKVYGSFSCADIDQNKVFADNFDISIFAIGSSITDITNNNNITLITNNTNFEVHINNDYMGQLKNSGYDNIKVNIKHPNYGFTNGSTTITTEEEKQLNTFSNILSDGNITSNISFTEYTLNNDINIHTTYQNLKAFKLNSGQTFNGNGKTINFGNQNIDGLFTLEQGITGSGTEKVDSPGDIPVIKNLTIKNAKINGEAGAFIQKEQYSSVIIDNCVSDCNGMNGIKASGFIGKDFARNDGNKSYYLRITNCINKTYINTHKSGGILGCASPSGNLYGKIYCEGCINYGNITDVYSGTFAGEGVGFSSDTNNGSVIIKNCINYGKNIYPDNITCLIGSGSNRITLEQCAHYRGSEYGVIYNGSLVSINNTTITNTNNYFSGQTATDISGFSYNPEISSHPTLNYFQRKITTFNNIDDNTNAPNYNIGLYEDNYLDISFDDISYNQQVSRYLSDVTAGQLEYRIKRKGDIDNSGNKIYSDLDNNNQSNNALQTSYGGYTLDPISLNTDTISITVNGALDENSYNTDISDLIIGVKDPDAPSNLDVYYEIANIDITINPIADNATWNTTNFPTFGSTNDTIIEDSNNGTQTYTIDITEANLNWTDKFDNDMSINDLAFSIDISCVSTTAPNSSPDPITNYLSGILNKNLNNISGTTNGSMYNELFDLSYSLTETTFTIQVIPKPHRNTANTSGLNNIKLGVKNPNVQNSNYHYITRTLTITPVSDKPTWNLQNKFFNQTGQNDIIIEDSNGGVDTYEITLGEEDIIFNDKYDTGIAMNSLEYDITINQDESNTIYSNVISSSSNNDSSLNNDLFNVIYKLETNTFTIEIVPNENRNTYNTQHINTLKVGIKNPTSSNTNDTEFSYFIKTITVTPVNDQPIFTSTKDVIQTDISNLTVNFVKKSYITIDFSPYVADIERDNYFRRTNHTLDISASNITSGLQITKTSNPYELVFTTDQEADQRLDFTLVVIDNGETDESSQQNNTIGPFELIVKASGFEKSVQSDTVLNVYIQDYLSEDISYNSVTKTYTLLRNFYYQDFLNRENISVADNTIQIPLLLGNEQTFDGNGYTLDMQEVPTQGLFRSWLWSNRQDDYSNITIKNMNIINANITSANGGILVASDSENITIENVRISGSDISNNNGGGLLGSNCSNCAIKDSYTRFREINGSFNPLIGNGTITTEETERYYSTIYKNNEENVSYNVINNRGFIYEESSRQVINL